MWLKKYLALPQERPLWAFVTDQIVFKFAQKAPVVKERNKINWILQSWNVTKTKEGKVPSYIKMMLKVERKYNIGYDVISAGKTQRRKMPIWHHIGVLDNYSWNKTLAIYLRLTHKIKTVGDLEDFIEKESRHWYCRRLAQKIMEKIPIQLHPSKQEIDDNLDLMPRRLRREREGDNELQYIIDPNTIDARSPVRAIQIFGSYKRYKDKKTRHETKLQMTPIRQTRLVILDTMKIYCTTTEPELSNDQPWYSAGIRIITADIDEMRTYRIDLKRLRESADLLTIIEALKLKGNISIKSNRTDSMLWKL